MNHSKKRILALLTLLTLLLASCAAGPIEVENPSTGLAEEIYLAENEGVADAETDAILSAFETALSSNEAEPLMRYVDESFTASEEELETFFESVSEHGAFTPYDRYCVRGLTEGAVPVLVKKTAEDETSLQVIPAARELCVALYTSGEGTPTETMLSLVCAKKGGKWSLAWIDITDYRYNGMDAPALYEKAKAAYDAGNVLPAFLLAQMTSNIATPANILRYPNSDAIAEFVYEVMTEGLADYPLPMELGGVTLHSVATSKTENGIVPMFFYSGETPIENTKALAREAKKVYNAIEKVFPGTVAAFPTAEFRITNADPEADENFDFETVIITMN